MTNNNDKPTIVLGAYDPDTGTITPYPPEQQAERLADIRDAIRDGTLATADARELGVPPELIESWLAGKDS